MSEAIDLDRIRRWRRVRRLLVVRLDNLGDLLMTTPAIAALRAGLPAAQITLLASPGAAQAVPLLPDIDASIAVEAPWVAAGVKAASQAVPGVVERRLVERLADGGFDAAVIFTVCTQSALPAALVCRMAGIELRLAHSRENPYALLSDWVRDRDEVGPGLRHEVRRQLDLVASVGMHALDTRLRLRCEPAVRRRMCERVAQALPGRGGFVVVHPGASAPSRRWPAERFGAAAAQIARARGLGVVFTGGPGEAPLLQAARAALGGLPSLVLDDLSLGELAALIAEARLLLANNSGPAHIAAALGTPLVELYALTNPQHTPWQANARVLHREVPCRDCLKSVCPQGHHACLLGVEVAEAVQAAMELIGTNGAVVARHHEAFA
ncbi:MAG TPA: glycosyltransferase family 9 protein [Methylibium sp.]|uniref:glycosyltransferase family 9 protein n=1 Tax=Methylibium sp. TaxID=2067992 RepID=UPI002DB80D87|nr:glycosyltransferase family 9 protein [Methylibium sp.]HEU4459117.1 glycosyltransferase family 9 protein [Methylibium sp.]